MRTRLIICILLAALILALRAEVDLFAQSSEDALPVKLEGSGSGYKIVHFTDGSMQRIDWNAEVTFDLEAKYPVQQGDVIVYATPIWEGSARFFGTAVDDFGGGFTLNFSTTINLSLVSGPGRTNVS